MQLITKFADYTRVLESASAKPTFVFTKKPVTLKQRAVNEHNGGLSAASKHAINALEFNPEYKEGFHTNRMPELIEYVHKQIGYEIEPIRDEIVQDVKKGVLGFYDMTADAFGPELEKWWNELSANTMELVRQGPKFVMAMKAGHESPQE